MSDSDDDSPKLSAETMAALMEFYKEEEERKDKLRQIEEGNVPEDFEENWNMSQFWYAKDTSEALAKECVRLMGKGKTIACVSAPTLYRSLKDLEYDGTLKVLEYDTRFSVYKNDYVFYDFKNPLAVPGDLRESCDLVIADPPYLDQNCLTKTSITVKFMAKPDAKVILCTGAVMEELAGRLLGLHKCQFEIKHNRQLSNPFACYANYDLDHHCKS